MIPRADKPIRPAAKNNVPTGKTEVRFASLLSGGFATTLMPVYHSLKPVLLGKWPLLQVCYKP